ncbi:MAG: MFS transporter [Deltaproteobacteria bacterium]|nr:MFS transporter [Deltaproteobacteria bacterium]MBW2343519.1 MFS transporter [Deltaproteobacteria bacterium]
MVPSFGSQIGPLLFLTTIFFLNFISRIILAPLMPAIEKDLGVSHGEAGSLFLLISAGYFISLLGSGFFSSRLLHKRTIIVSATAVGVALFGIAFTDSLWGTRMVLVLLGLASGLYLPSGIATLTALISPRHWGKAIAIHELAPNLGFVAAPLVSEALLTWFSWRGVLVFLGGLSVLMGIAFARLGRGGEFPGEPPNFAAFKALFREPAFWIMMFLFSLGIGGTLGVYTMLPLYLITEHGINRNRANTLIALSRIPGIGMAFLAGWANDRLGPRRTIEMAFLLTGFMTILLGAAPAPWITTIVFLQPIIAVCFFPPGFAALSSIGPPNARNVAVSLTVPFAFVLGGGAIPIGIGIMGDTGSFSLGIAMTGGLILMGFILSLYLRLPDSVN